MTRRTAGSRRAKRLGPAAEILVTIGTARRTGSGSLGDSPDCLTGVPLVWMLQVNGLMIDIRQALAELQRLAYEKGLIPFIPAERGDTDT
jgi:hypothetical protein